MGVMTSCGPPVYGCGSGPKTPLIRPTSRGNQQERLLHHRCAQQGHPQLGYQSDSGGLQAAATANSGSTLQTASATSCTNTP
jgi:hypothetical protein